MLQAVIDQRLLGASCVKKHLEDAVKQFQQRFLQHSATAAQPGSQQPNSVAEDGKPSVPGFRSSEAAAASSLRTGKVTSAGGRSGKDGNMHDESESDASDSGDDEEIASNALKKLLAASSRRSRHALGAAGAVDGAGLAPDVPSSNGGSQATDDSDDNDCDDVILDLAGAADAALLPRTADGYENAEQASSSDQEAGVMSDQGSDELDNDSFNSADFDQIQADQASSSSSSDGDGSAHGRRGQSQQAASRSVGGTKGQSSQASAGNKRELADLQRPGGEGAAAKKAKPDAKHSDGIPAGKKSSAAAGKADKLPPPPKLPKQPKPKKNRVGQRERRKQAEKQYGRDANHLKQPDRDDRRQQPPALRKHSAGAGNGLHSPAEPESLHPSWQAKRQQKVAVSAVPQAGTKVVFDDDGCAAPVATQQPAQPSSAHGLKRQRDGSGVARGKAAGAGAAAAAAENSGARTLAGKSGASLGHKPHAHKHSQGDRDAGGSSGPAVHPSWAAKKAQAAAAKLKALAKPAGSKIVFDD